MPQVTIIPKFINPPRGNARSASIKDENGGYWGIHPGDMSKFQQNVPVTVEYVTSENNGKTYYNIKSIVGQQVKNSAPPRQTVQPLPDVKKAEDIFVCGVVNHAIAHQSYPLDMGQLTQLVQMARHAWRHGEPDAQSEPPFPGSPDDYGDVDPRG